MTIRAPEKLGYDFGGWLKITKDADGNEVAEKIDAIPDTIGSENCNFRAVWTEREDARFTVVYWRENPDDPGYGYWGEKIVTGVKSGSAIDTALFDKYDIPTPKTGNDDEDIHEDELQHYTYNEEKTLKSIPEGGVVAGDGSTIINVYYTRNLYTLRFIFARSREEWSWEGRKTVYQIPGGSTWTFGKSGSARTNDVRTLLRQVGSWGNVSAMPSPENGMNYEVKSFEDTQYGYTYYYFDITRKYGAILNDVWPTTERMKKVKLQSARNEREYAVFSAWNGEVFVKYTQENSNETIKGRYLRLDDDLLYAQQYQKKADGTDNYNYDDSGHRVVHFLSFWENGADVDRSWNKARKWVYEIYTEPRIIEQEYALGGTLDNANAQALMKNPNQPVTITYTDPDTNQMTKRDWVYFDGIDRYKNNPKIKPGFYYILRLGDMEGRYTCCDDNEYNKLDTQTPPGMLGFEIPYGYSERRDFSRNDDSTYYYDDYENVARFFYDRKLYALHINNNGESIDRDNDPVGTGYTVKYGRMIRLVLNAIKANPNISTDDLRHATDAPADLVKALTPRTPTNIDPTAYTFAGWYSSPTFVPGTELTETVTMPARQETYYAKWVPVTHTVTYSTSYSTMKENKYIELNGKEQFTVQHGEKLYSYNIPATDNLKDIFLDGKSYDFIGWFYENSEGQRRPFDPTTMPVTDDMHLYAEWRSSEIVPFTVRYVEKRTDKEIAPSVTGHTYSGLTRTFNAKAGDELNDGYKTGWYPTTNSSSIIAGIQKECVFEYVPLDEVHYTVRYIDDTTGKEFDVSVVKPKENVTTSASIITERFVPIAGYISDAFYKTLILSANEAENVIVFHYTKNEKDVRYTVVHMTEQLDGSYAEHHTDSLVGNAGEHIQRNAADISGYTYNSVVTNDHKPNDQKYDVTSTGFSATLSQKEALTVYLYYTRNEYKYSIQYVDSETGDVLCEAEKGNAKFGNEISYNAPETLDGYSLLINNGWKYVISGSTERSFTVAADDSQVFKIPYTAKKADILYIPISLYGSGTGGEVTISAESGIHSLSEIKGSTPKANDGYVFKGWFTDSSCSTPVNEAWVGSDDLLKPGELNLDRTTVYYALFEPIRADLVISKTVSGGSSDSFLFRVKGTDGTATADVDITVSIKGSDSVTVKDLPVGDYTVSELTEWSWRYQNDGSAALDVTVVAGKDNTAAFSNTPNSKKWLGGETEKDNRFNPYSEN